MITAPCGSLATQLNSLFYPGYHPLRLYRSTRATSFQGSRPTPIGARARLGLLTSNTLRKQPFLSTHFRNHKNNITMDISRDTSMYIANAADYSNNPGGGDIGQQQQFTSSGTNNPTPSPTVLAPPPTLGGVTAPPRPAPPVDNVPVFVMLPLDTVNADGVFKYAASRWFLAALQQLQESGIHGVAVDVWWAGVERRPRRYDWSGYRQLFDLLSSLGLKLQVVMAFHACGGNVGDNAEVPLPAWVVAAGERDPDIFFTDRPRELTPGQRNRECISLFAAEEPGLLKGRSAMQCYVDFMRSFREEFKTELGSLIEEIVVGAGPCGELRYPSYPEPNGWRFPGIGEFQCYDRRGLASLARAAMAVGRPEWGNAGPHDAGTYNSGPEETGFFRGWGGRWDTEYGRFFLGWYSQALLEHGERMLGAAGSVFNVVSSNENTSKNVSVLSGKERQDSLGVLDTPRSVDELSEGAGGGWNVPMSSISAGGGGGSGGVGGGPWRQGSGASIGTTSQGRGASVGSLEGLAGGLNTNNNTSGGGGSGLPPLPGAPLEKANSLPSPEQQPPLQQQQPPPASLIIPPSPAGGTGGSGSAPPSLSGAPVPTSTTTNNNNNTAAAGGNGGGNVSRPPSFASFRSSSISEGLNALEDWTWPSPSGPPVGITLKIAGVHWWYRTRSHAAEVTAGYYNCDGGSGYDAIVALCAR
jgi:Glycosyl hydrolase family 14